MQKKANKLLHVEAVNKIITNSIRDKNQQLHKWVPLMKSTNANK